MTHNPIMSRERVLIPPRPAPTKAQKVAAWNRPGLALGARARWGELSDAELFHKHVQPDTNGGCWLWSGTGCGRYGHAYDRETGRPGLAHRVSWRIYRGPIPDGLIVCHRCDVTRCVNPDHLFLGTSRDNMQDMHRKGRDRYVRGSAVPSAKLSEHHVREIVCRLLNGEHPVQIAADYGVTKEAITAIRRGANWRHITGGPIS